VLTPASNRVIIGAAYRFTAPFHELYEIWDAANHVVDVTLTNTGSIKITMFGGTPPPFVESAVDVWRQDQWHYIEVDCTISSSMSGSNTHYTLLACQAYVDGGLVIDSALGLGGANAALATPYKWTFMDITPTGDAAGVMDDFYVCDGSGAAPHNAPLGDMRIDVIRPNGAGAATAWTPTGAASNWDAVNDLTPDGDTTKVSAATAALSDLYALEDISTGNTVVGAQILVNARRTAEGFATVTPLLRHAGVTTGLTSQPLSTSYYYQARQCFVAMPNGDPLTDAHVNALQAGVRREA
jgi:hypothetical protein